MDPDRTRRKRSRRIPSDGVVDLINHSNRREPSDPLILEEEGNGASTSVAIVDLTKDSNDSILSGDIVDLTETNGFEDIEEVTPPKRSRGRRSRSAQQTGSGNSVVISSEDESDDSDDLVLLNSPLPDEVTERLASLKPGSSPPKKLIKCPICYDDDTTVSYSVFVIIVIT
ncbi:hypothetical protein BSL78_12292 [Apostichopus japonicus]|uniref:E3 ubiquitin-protein ligase RNF4 n=1 Tax=Stichopus japonicus TaxID=307972 RepID=A0A2G8KS38_STIJA|nr:hypothetical protein BSL78_12292 [Apostichopus japonicus]